jgi:hypothetical protein
LELEFAKPSDFYSLSFKEFINETHKFSNAGFTRFYNSCFDKPTFAQQLKTTPQYKSGSLNVKLIRDNWKSRWQN